MFSQLPLEYTILFPAKTSGPPTGTVTHKELGCLSLLSLSPLLSLWIQAPCDRHSVLSPI